MFVFYIALLCFPLLCIALLCFALLCIPIALLCKLLSFAVTCNGFCGVGGWREGKGVTCNGFCGVGGWREVSHVTVSVGMGNREEKRCHM